jgi:CRP/FNR family cyclic AMP-dependent transcriptional regulator
LSWTFPQENRDMPTSSEEQIRLLSMVDLLEPLSREELEEFARRCLDTHVGRGESLYVPQERGERLFILKSGRVQVYEVGPEGREITLSVVEGGNILGEMVLTGQLSSGVYVRALEPSVLCSLRQRDLERLILGNPEVGLRLVRLLSERLRLAETRLAEFTHKNVAARLANQILRFVQSEGVVTREGHYRIPTRYTHQQLGTMIGAGRVAVSRAFADLREAGAVELRNRYIHVVDLEALRRAAGVG